MKSPSFNNIWHFHLWLCITSRKVLWAQKVEVSTKVTGFVGEDVTLPCQLNKENTDAKITQYQWDILSPDGNKTTIIVAFNESFKSIRDSPLQDRVDVIAQSLEIKDAKISDAGSYTCTISTFPAGAFHGTTQLFVKEHRPVSAGIISAITFGVLLLLLLCTVVYFINIRRRSRRDSIESLRVQPDSCGLGAGVTLSSAIAREQDVVYSAVKRNSTTNTNPSAQSKPKAAPLHNDIIYSEVEILHRCPKSHLV